MSGRGEQVDDREAVTEETLKTKFQPQRLRDLNLNVMKLVQKDFSPEFMCNSNRPILDYGPNTFES